MNIEQEMKKFKRAYLETKPSPEFLEKGWQDLRGKMAGMEQTKARFWLSYSRPVVFAVILFFILAGFAGLVGASANSLPGEPLYPLKRLSEETVSMATGNNLVKVDNRAKEIIKLSGDKKGSSKLQKAVEEYKTAVLEASGKGSNLQKLEEELKENEAQFQQTSGSSNEFIREAIETSRRGRGGGEEENKEDNSGKGSGGQTQEQEDRSGSNSNSGSNSGSN